MTAFLDTNVLVRHLTNDPPEQAERATRYIHESYNLLLPDLIVAEVTYVLDSFYDFTRAEIAAGLESTLSEESIVVTDVQLLLRSLEIYETHRLDFADAYLIALAERTGVGAVASFDRDIDRPGTVIRIEPA